MNNLLTAANKALDNLAKAYPVEERTPSIQDRVDDLIDIIEDKYDLHVCNFTREQALDLSKLLANLAEYI